MDNVNSYCRFCNIPLRNANGQIHHSKLIFEKTKTEKDKNIFMRLRDLGLSLSNCRDKSFRSCVKCDTLVKRLEIALPAFRQWEEDEKVSGSNPGAASAASHSTSSHAVSTTSASPTPSSHGSSSSDKRAQVTPSETPSKKICQNPPSPARTTKIAEEGNFFFAPADSSTGPRLSQSEQQNAIEDDDILMVVI